MHSNVSSLGSLRHSVSEGKREYRVGGIVARQAAT